MHECIWFFVGIGKRRVAPVFQVDIAAIVYCLIRIQEGIHMVQLPFSIIDNFHFGGDAVFTFDHLVLGIDENDREICFCEFDFLVIRFEIIDIRVLSGTDNRRNQKRDKNKFLIKYVLLSE